MNTTTNTSTGFGFWASLPLSRKLLIAFGALFVLGLVIAACYLHKCWAVCAAAVYQASAKLGSRIRGVLDRLGAVHCDAAILAFRATH